MRPPQIGWDGSLFEFSIATSGDDGCRGDIRHARYYTQVTIGATGRLTSPCASGSFCDRLLTHQAISCYAPHVADSVEEIGQGAPIDWDAKRLNQYSKRLVTLAAKKKKRLAAMAKLGLTPEILAQERARISNVIRRLPHYTPPTPQQVTDLRVSLTMTHDMFASVMGLGKRTTDQWEKGKRIPLRKHAALMTRLAQMNGIDWPRMTDALGVGKPVTDPITDVGPIDEAEEIR
jgi:DNA-binding transcriptional regulator YiaG